MVTMSVFCHMDKLVKKLHAAQSSPLVVEISSFAFFCFIPLLFAAIIRQYFFANNFVLGDVGRRTGSGKVFTQENALLWLSHIDQLHSFVFNQTHTMSGSGNGPMRGIIPRALQVLVLESSGKLISCCIHNIAALLCSKLACTKTDLKPKGGSMTWK